MPRITVLMGIYNCAPTLPAALDSLLAQTFQDFKVVLCDDGSTDDTYQVAKEYADKYADKFILIKNERNMKLAATLNHCLDYADTEYVARMDGDDLSLPTRFEKEIKFLDEHPEYALVSCPMAHFDETGIWKRGSAKECPVNDDFRFGPPFCHAPSMMRREALMAVNGYTAEPRVERVEDYYLWYKLYKHGFKGYNLQEILYHMRDDMNAVHRRKFSDRVKAYHVNVEIGKGLGIKCLRLSALLNLSKAFVPPFLAQFLRKLLK